MLTRRNRDLLPQKTGPTPFAAKAKDLGALHEAVVDAASVGAGLWVSYLFALFYFAIAAGAVTHRDLLLESPVKLPFLNVELPLKAFFILGPLVFLILHAYVLLHFVLLAGRIGAFHLELETQIGGDDAQTRLRRQLPSNIFVQSFAGPREVRTGIIGFLLRRIIEISLVVGPIALLVLFQLQFLPYHSEWITSWQRTAVVIDLVLLWILWPRIARGESAGLVWVDFKRVKVQAWLLASFLPVLVMVTIATFPGESLEQTLRPVPGWATLHKLLVAGEVNYVTGMPQSPWSNVLVLPKFDIGDRGKFDAEAKIAISSDALSLRGRSLEGAVLVFAHLRKADFSGASLAGADFTGADLREANFAFDWIRHAILGLLAFPLPLPIGDYEPRPCNEDIGCAQLQGAHFDYAQLQGASFARARLQGAEFGGAQLQGANLDQAQLQGAMFFAANLQGASLRAAQLQGASLREAQLQAANFYQAQLQGADFRDSVLYGANLDGAQLQGVLLGQEKLPVGVRPFYGTSLRGNYVWRTYPPSNMDGALVGAPEPAPKYSGLNCPNGACDWSETSYTALRSLIENSVPLAGGQRDQALEQIAILEKPPYVVDEGSAKAWADLAKESARSAGSYFDTLAKILSLLGCQDGARYVIDGLIRVQGLDYRFEWKSAQEAQVATAFLDEEKCPGARGLSEESKTRLREIRNRGRLGAPAPGAAAR